MKMENAKFISFLGAHTEMIPLSELQIVRFDHFGWHWIALQPPASELRINKEII